MGMNARWLLPEGIEELPPPQAARLEKLRRQLLDCYASWGYELVMPPFIEFVESLQSGTGGDLDQQTFKLTDPLSGRAMGVRADMTPQAARIDAHVLKREQPVRLCYLGTVLRAVADGFASSRAPLQIGAELYGHSGIESELEIIGLMLETLKMTGLDSVTLDLGHVGIFRSLAAEAGLDSVQEGQFFDALQRKAVTEIADYLQQWQLPSKVSKALEALARLNGGIGVLDQARKVLKGFKGAIAGLDNLQDLADALVQRQPGLNMHFDLGELRGYNYHTGTVFAVFIESHGQEVARGGRYDDVGRDFGRARPATGFSADLKLLIGLSGALNQLSDKNAIMAPSGNDEALMRAIAELRGQGECVIAALPGQKGVAADFGCNRELVAEDGHWKVVEIS